MKLEGEAAIEFLKQVEKRDKEGLSEEEKKFLDECEQIYKKHSPTYQRIGKMSEVILLLVDELKERTTDYDDNPPSNWCRECWDVSKHDYAHSPDCKLMKLIERAEKLVLGEL